MTVKNETDSPILDCCMTRLGRDPRKFDEMQRACSTLAGAKERAAWLLDRDPALRNEFDSAEALA
jgi:hypothetical protein